MNRIKYTVKIHDMPVEIVSLFQPNSEAGVTGVLQWVSNIAHTHYPLVSCHMTPIVGDSCDDARPRSNSKHHKMPGHS